MTNPSATNSRNKWGRRRARPAAGAASCPAWAAEQTFSSEVGTGSRWENASKEGSWPAAGLRFSCQAGRCPISGAGVFSPVAERAAWSAAIAQLVEHVIRNDWVTGSNPVCGTKEIKDLAELAPAFRIRCPHGVRSDLARPPIRSLHCLMPVDREIV